MVRIWMNHWFSTAYHIINLIKVDSEFYVIGSNDKKYSIIQNACDEWYEEPILLVDDYIDYCLDFCKKHSVDVFIPRRKMEEISKNREKFERLGVKLLLDSYELISVLNHKEQAYQTLQNCKNVKVPEYYVVENVDELRIAYERLNKKYNRVCYKHVMDEGGLSFRTIDSIDQVIKRLPSTFSKMMVMPYLPGFEVSVDCLMTQSGLIAVPRIKGPTRDELVHFDDEILLMCEEILERFPLQYPCNIQFKYLDEIPYFLEVNTRMSGGIQMGCLASNINIPNIAVHKLLGHQKDWTCDRTIKRVSYIETPQIIRSWE